MNNKILVVDDDRAINELIKVNLELVGYTVVQAYDGIEGFAVANIVNGIDKDNYKEWALYTDLQRGCFGDLTNGEEVTGYLPESGAYLAEDAINASLNAAQSIVSDLDSKLVSDDLNWTKGGYIIFTSQPVRRG